MIKINVNVYGWSFFHCLLLTVSLLIFLPVLAFIDELPRSFSTKSKKLSAFATTFFLDDAVILFFSGFSSTPILLSSFTSYTWINVLDNLFL